MIEKLIANNVPLEEETLQNKGVMQRLFRLVAFDDDDYTNPGLWQMCDVEVDEDDPLLDPAI